jgi:hypothetical protein
MFDQIPIGWKSLQVFARKLLRRLKAAQRCRPVIQATVVVALVRAKAHTVQHILITGRGKYFLDFVEIPAAGRAITPQFQQFRETRGNGFLASVINPELGIVTLAQLLL